VRGLTKHYGAVRAVDGLDLLVRPGEFFGFLGPNGAGKSTTMRILCGLLRPTSGSVEVAGVDVLRDPVSAKARIGVLPEEPVLYERLSGREMLWYAGRLYGMPGQIVEQRSADLLRLMGLDDGDSERPVLDYSMGMRKKVGLCCALLHRPRVLFLDEPFNGIDAVTSRSIYAVLRGAVGAGMTVFFTSHVLEVAEALCDRVGIVAKGRLRACGTLAEVRREAGAPEGTPLGQVFVDLVDPGSRDQGREWIGWLTGAGASPLPGPPPLAREGE
jgi:ABC-2 type transport system ATP-binding protein